MRIYSCDHCGSEVETGGEMDGHVPHQNWGSIHITVRMIGVPGPPRPLIRRQCELCPDCLAQFDNFVTKAQV